MPTYKYYKNDVVLVIEDNGDIRISGLETAVVPTGATILPADPPQLTQEDIDLQTARQYVKLQALRNMTPQEVQTWVDNNITDLASAKDAIKTLAVAIGILARRI